MIYRYFFHLLRTVFGFYQKPFSSEWDSRLNEIIDSGSIVEAGEHTVIYQMGSDVIEVWISNRWYSFAHVYLVNGKFVSKEFQNRPRLNTMIRLWDIYSVERNKFLSQEYDQLFKKN